MQRECLLHGRFSPRSHPLIQSRVKRQTDCVLCSSLIRSVEEMDMQICSFFPIWRLTSKCPIRSKKHQSNFPRGCWRRDGDGWMNSCSVTILNHFSWREFLKGQQLHLNTIYVFFQHIFATFSFIKMHHKWICKWNSIKVGTSLCVSSSPLINHIPNAQWQSTFTRYTPPLMRLKQIRAIAVIFNKRHLWRLD